MSFKDLFRKRKSEPAIDPLHDLVLAKLRAGYLVDYDLKTWQVTAYCRYDFDGERVEEWELLAGRDKRYLELESEEEAWSWSQKVPIGAIDGDVRKHILEHDDPPDRITYQETTYYLDASYAGHAYANGEGSGQPLIRWEFLDEAEEAHVSIEQWSETELEANVGSRVEEYQFTNILPGAAE